MKRSLLTSVLFIPLLLGCIKEERLSWQNIDMGFSDSFHDIEPVDKNTAIAYSYGSGLIVKTVDQGKTWNLVHRTDSIYYEQIEFPTPDIGYICGNTNKILKTVNGGDSWFEIILDSIPESASIYGMKFLDPATGYFSLLNRTEHGFGSDIYKTTNSGLDWTLVNTIPEMLLNIELVGNELWASGHNVVFKNIDRDWQIVYKDTAKEVGQIRDFVYNNGTLIMASFNGFIIRKTEDQTIKERITKNRIRSIVAISGERLLAAGDNNKDQGNVFESYDNGRTWQLIDIDLPDIHRLVFKDGVVWGVGKQHTFIMLKI